MELHGFAGPSQTPQARAISPSNLSSGQPILGIRPLSDIREITEPSLAESTRRKEIAHQSNQVVGSSRHPMQDSRSLKPQQDSKIGASQEQKSRTSAERTDSRQAQVAPTPQLQRPQSRRSRWSPDRSHEDDTTKSSLYSINLKKVPLRSSSRPRHRPSHSLPRAPAVSIVPNTSKAVVMNRRTSTSPLKEAAERLSGDKSAKQRVPSKTIIKIDNPNVNDILASPTYHHPRIQLDIQMAAGLFVGGSTVEGVVRLVVDQAARVKHRKTLNLEQLSIDLLGVEEVFGNRRHVFLSLGNELIDVDHPPPNTMIDSEQRSSAPGQPWPLASCTAKLPFLLTLPLEVGPPPFKSKNARIRYSLSATLMVKDAGRQLCVRSSQETSILSVYDPERALVSLPSPLTSSDEILLQKGREKVVVTAGLHRQVWVNGTTLFADVHIDNHSRKAIKRIDLQLEQIILFYRHAAASTLEMSASQARLFDETERSTVCKSTIKQNSQGWAGIPPFSSDLRTCSIDLPRGYATIKCNKYCEVRYLLNVVVPVGHSFSSSKALRIQLPIILIHMSSLDVPTNSVAQVAAAIEQKRKPSTLPDDVNSNTLSTTSEGPAEAAAAATARGSPQRRIHRKESRNLQGRAFSAPRAASIERQRAHQKDMKALGQALEASPRKHSRTDRPATRAEEVRNADIVDNSGAPFSFKTPPNNRKGQVIVAEDADELRHQLGGSTQSTSKAAVELNEHAVADRRDPPRSASAMGYYIPSEDIGRDRENRKPSMEGATRMPVRHSAESNRPKMRERKNVPDGTVGGVHLMGVPDAPPKRGPSPENTMAGRPQWVPERDQWRPHWL